ncbi:MAG TPA: hypothetical protein VMZ26_02785 [Pyrinomonadaceae bacterium]|nr:hypothetical protein [Pyrinomonadaceae bacterium]
MKITTLFAGILTAVFAFTFGVSLTSVISYFSETSKSSQPVATRQNGIWISAAGGTTIKGQELQDRSGRYLLQPNFDGEFANFKYVDIESPTYSYNAEREWEGHLTGAKALVNEIEITFDSFFLDATRIMFETEPVKGESYVFMGSFRNRATCGIDLVEPGFNGYLLKLKDGKFVASMEASFYRVYGC